MLHTCPKTLFEPSLSDPVAPGHTITKQLAECLFRYFKNNRVFRWMNAHNDCEDRANAACLLLDQWGIPNYKGWVFSGYFLKKKGGYLVNSWNYHVAPLLPVEEDGGTNLYIIDPSTLNAPATIDFWAGNVTDTAPNYHLVKRSHYYIFPAGKIERDNWFKRDRQNFKWTMQGLTGINGLSAAGKAQICFHKQKIKKTELLFKELSQKNQPFLYQTV